MRNIIEESIWSTKSSMPSRVDGDRIKDYQHKQMLKDLRSCMRCKYFTGNNSQCISRDCIKAQNSESKLTKQERKVFREEKGCYYCEHYNSKKCNANGSCPMEKNKNQMEEIND